MGRWLDGQEESTNRRTIRTVEEAKRRQSHYFLSRGRLLQLLRREGHHTQQGQCGICEGRGSNARYREVGLGDETGCLGERRFPEDPP